MTQSDGLVLGVDVGTASARAGIFDLRGRRLGHAAHPIEIGRPQASFVEQSSDDIWQAIGRAVQSALSMAGCGPDRVRGMSFDATSSLVALDAADRPVTISPTGRDQWNVIVWMDHRSLAETEEINATGHDVLRYVGGRISPEMAPPKLLWIRRNLPQSWRRAARFLELPDFLTYRATGVDVRSTCTTACKWTYLAHEDRWAADFFERLGLSDLLTEHKAGRGVKPMGTTLGGLTPAAARELGLRPGIPVGAGIIDAHAGALGLFAAAVAGMGGAELWGGGRGPGAPVEAGRGEELERVLALIGGTSSCHLAVSREPRFIPGIWGPYYSALVPGMWLTEGGQTSTGSLIDHVIADSAPAEHLQRASRERGETVYEALNREVLAWEGEHPGGELTFDLHVLPYFHGNRSPRADPGLKGAVSGLTLEETRESLAARYLAAIQAIAYGTRHIIEAMNAAGYRIDTILVSGGGAKNPVWLREHADATGCRLVLPREPEAVLLGSAMLGAVGGGCFGSLGEAMAGLGGAERAIEPNPRRREFHDRKYRAFHRMYDHLLELRRVMDPA